MSNDQINDAFRKFWDEQPAHKRHNRAICKDVWYTRENEIELLNYKSNLKTEALEWICKYPGVPKEIYEKAQAALNPIYG